MSFDELAGPELELNTPGQPEQDFNDIDNLPISQLPDVPCSRNESSRQTSLAEGNRAWTPVSLFQAPLTTDGSDAAFDFFGTTSKAKAMDYDYGTNTRSRPDVQTTHISCRPSDFEQDRLSFLQNPRIPPDLLPRNATVSLPSSRGNDPRIVESLLHHYKTHVSRLMMPTSAPSQNPYLCIYLPLALESPSGGAKQSLLMAILAVAAFNKAELETSDAKKYRAHAANFTERASSILKSYAGASGRERPSLADEIDRKALLATVVTMTTVEVCR